MDGAMRHQSELVAQQPKRLIDYGANVYSQIGEDGIVAAILDILPEKDGWCVEFGAWDGIYLSNTRNLIESKGYKAVLIEGSATSFTKLRMNTAHMKDVIPILAFVGFSGEDGLDSILERTPCPRNFDFLSIDVDGNDIHIWRALKKHRPKLVCIEFNPTIPTEVLFEQKADKRVNQGSSLRSLVLAGKAKGYELVCVNDWNAFFVTEELFPLFEIEDNSPEALRPKDAPRIMVFAGYDGTLLLSGKVSIPWHRMEFSQADIQALPRLLRKYPLNYSRIEALAARAWRFIRRVKVPLPTRSA
jgi:hypothetical protein